MSSAARWGLAGFVGIVNLALLGFATLSFLGSNTYFRPIAYRDDLPPGVLEQAYASGRGLATDIYVPLILLALLNGTCLAWALATRQREPRGG